MLVFDLWVKGPCFGDVRFSTDGTYTIVAPSLPDALDAVERLAFTNTTHMGDHRDVASRRDSFTQNSDHGIAAAIKLIQNLLGSIRINCIVFDGSEASEGVAYFDVSEGDKRRVITMRAVPEDDVLKHGRWLKPFAVDVAEKIIARF